MTFIFRNRTIFWDISKWNRGQKSGTEGVYIYIYIHARTTKINLYLSCKQENY